MKKHLTSIESTRPAEDGSMCSPDEREMKLGYKTSIIKLFDSMSQVLKLRSFLLFRDMGQIYQNCQSLFDKILKVHTPKQLWQTAFPNKKQSQKIYEKGQIAFLVKLVLELDKLRKQSANLGRSQQFQIQKSALQLLQQKIIEYQQKIRKKKYHDKMEKKLQEKQVNKKSIYAFQKSVRQNLKAKHDNQKQLFLQKVNFENTINVEETQKSKNRFNYKAKPSKLLSQLKDLSLRAKLSPYASQLKRSYDYNSLQNSLSKTLDLEMTRKINLISHMKQIQRQKLDRSHKKRYSVLQDRMDKQKDATERKLTNRRFQLQNSQRIGLEKMHQKSIRKQCSRIQSLQKSFNAYNMHSDTRQIKNILRNHHQTIQFSNQLQAVSNLNSSYSCQPSYGTSLTNQMLKSTHVSNQKRRQSNYDKKILRKFSKSKKQNEQIDSDAQADDICSSNRRQQSFRRQKSLAALYDDQLNQIK